MEKEKLQSYWRSNLKYLIILCTLWFIFALLFPIVMVDSLNAIRIGGIPLGFWFAAQGTFISMIILLFLYVRWMNKLDEKHGFGE